MSQSLDSSNTRKPLKKRKMDGFDFMESDDEDENQLLFGSPAFRQHNDDDTRDNDKPKQQQQQQASPPTRRSPRGRTSIATLDGVTSSPSHVASPESSTAHSACATAANSPPHPFNDMNEQQEVIVLDVDDGDDEDKDDDDYDKDDEDFELHGVTKKVKPKPKAQGRKRKSSSRTDSLGNLPVTQNDSSSRFALTRVNNATSSSSSSTTTTTKKKPPKEAKKERNKLKTSIDSNNNVDEDTTVPTEEAASNTKDKSKSSRTNAASTNEADAAYNTSPSTENPSPPKKTKKKKKAKKAKPAAETSTDTAKENAANTSPTQSTLPSKKVKTNDSDGSAVKAVSAVAKSPLATQDTIAKETPKSSSTVDSSNKRSSTWSTSTEKPKKKKKKLNFQDQVFQHMFLGMKPFTLKSLAAELNQTDTALNYVMLSLVDKGLVVKRDITSNKGRTKTLYWAVDGVTSKEVAATHAANPAECQAAKQKLQSVQAELSSMLKTMADIQSDLSNQEVDERLQQQEAALNECKDKIQAIRTRMQATVAKPKPRGSMRFGAPPKKPATIPQLKRRFNHMRDEWKQRKQKCMDFCDQLADAMEKKRKDVLKLLDVETDEECKVALPAKYEVEPAATQKKR